MIEIRNGDYQMRRTDYLARAIQSPGVRKGPENMPLFSLSAAQFASITPFPEAIFLSVYKVLKISIRRKFTAPIMLPTKIVGLFSMQF
jgi:hypothetical protein